MTNDKISEEVKDVTSALNAYAKKHHYVAIICSITAFDKDTSNVIDDRLILYGVKNVLQIDCEQIAKLISTDKRGFIIND